MTKKEEFATGAVRDSQEDKPRFDLITPTFLLRLATLLGEKAKHYGDRNWEQGINTSRSFASLERHVQAIKRGDRTEDHIAQAAANLMFLAEEQDGPHDDLHELWGPSIRRDVEDLKSTETNKVTAFHNLSDVSLAYAAKEPDGTKIYMDTYGREWFKVSESSDAEPAWKRLAGPFYGKMVGSWAQVKSDYSDSFPWRIL